MSTVKKMNEKYLIPRILAITPQTEQFCFRDFQHSRTMKKALIIKAPTVVKLKCFLLSIEVINSLIG